MTIGGRFFKLALNVFISSLPISLRRALNRCTNCARVKVSAISMLLSQAISCSYSIVDNERQDVNQNTILVSTERNILS